MAEYEMEFQKLKLNKKYIPKDFHAKAQRREDRKGVIPYLLFASSASQRLCVRYIK